MDGSAAARPQDEQEIFVECDDTAGLRKRIAMRDQLIRRVFEEEFLGFARTHGEESLYLVGFETDALRIWDRLGLDYRSNVIRDRIERINRLEELSLSNLERIASNIKSETFQCVVAAARFDWKRGKIKRHAEERRRREINSTPSEEDLLWKKIR